MANAFDFDIVEATNAEDFKEMVIRYLNDGWEFHGTTQVVANSGTGNFRYMQAFKKDAGRSGMVGFSFPR